MKDWQGKPMQVFTKVHSTDVCISMQGRKKFSAVVRPICKLLSKKKES